MKAAIHSLSKFLDKVTSVVTGIFMTALCTLIFAAIVARFVFNKPIAWQYEATLVALCWIVFLGMSMTFRAEEHLHLTFLTNGLKPKAYVIWMNVIDLFLIAFLIIGIVCSVSIISTTWGTFYKTIPVRKGLYYLSFPIGCGLSIVHLIDLILCRKATDAPTAEPKEIQGVE